jgi:ADP-ribose pyrophosphatase
LGPKLTRGGSRELVYENPYQQVYRVVLELGGLSKSIFVTDYGDRAGVIVEGPRGILLVRQYRHLIDCLSWEIPGGKVDDGETPEEAALRECREETGVFCHDLKPLLLFHPGLDTLHNPTYLFHTHDFREESHATPPCNNEVCSQEWLPLDKCISMISSQIIVDSLSVIALLSYKTFISKT